MPIEQVVTVSLPRSSSVVLPGSGSGWLPGSSVADLWDALTAAGRGLTGATRVVVLRADGGEYADDVAAAHAAADRSSDEPPGAAIEWLTRPDVITIAAVRGSVTGGVLDAALACDLRIVADDAQLSASGSVNGVARLGELMGYSRALEFVVTGAAITGRQALAVGLANLSVASQMLDAAVGELVESVLRTPREAATVAKAVLLESAAGRRRIADELVEGLRLAAAESP